MDRDIAAMRTQEKKALAECKKYVKMKEVGAAKIIAKQVAQTRKMIERQYLAKAQLNSVAMEIQSSISMMKVKGCVSKSVTVLQTMNNLVKLPELRETMTEMAREMEKAGLMDEMLDDAFEMVEPAGLEGEAEQEVNQIIEELTAAALAPAADAPSKKPAAVAAPCEEPQVAAEDDALDAELQAMRDRLQAL